MAVALAMAVIWIEGENFKTAPEGLEMAAGPKAAASGGRTLYGGALDNKGSVVTYELIRLSDNKTIEARVLLTEILMWNQDTEADQHTQVMHEGFPDMGSIMLGVRLLARVKQENGNV